jgi:hypothetical protein
MIANEVDKLPKVLSELEETFNLQLFEAGISDFDREIELQEIDRKWRFDFFFPTIGAIVEINGGTWMQKSGHSTGKGIQRDYEKSNAAQLAGFKYLQFTGKEIDNRVAIDTVKRLLEGIQ